jgi:hypothetical protein
VVHRWKHEGYKAAVLRCVCDRLQYFRQNCTSKSSASAAAVCIDACCVDSYAILLLAVAGCSLSHLVLLEPCTEKAYHAAAHR